MMLRNGKSRMGWIILVIFLLFLTAIVARVDDWRRDWTTNWAETDPQADAADLRPLHSPLPADALEKEVLEWVSEQSQWQVAAESRQNTSSGLLTNSTDRSPRHLHLVRSTRIMQFKDDVHVTLDRDPETGGSVLHVKSRSRVGRGDLGQNPRNIKELIAAVKRRHQRNQASP